MDKKYHTIVFLGRFEPVHSAHAEMIRRASELAKQVIIIVGSCDQPRTFKNPFTFEERKAMIVPIINKVVPANVAVRIESNFDTVYDNQAWAIRVQEIVKKHTQAIDTIALIGHKKDKSTEEYLSMFPQWKLEEIGLIEPLNATDIRDLYFRRDSNLNFIKGVVPANVLQFLEGFKNSKEYENIIEAREFNTEYQKPYAGLKYPVIFVTVDAVVVQSGHVLMVKRKHNPGKGLWALPGGFVNACTDNSVQDAMIRELREETGIKVPVPVLIGSLNGPKGDKLPKVFDYINRSERGRTITHAYYLEFPAGPLPHVKGQDDAEKAKFIPIAEVKREQCFEDHWDIISHYINI